MVIEPRVLLLDEPLSNLDASLREEMRFEIRRLHDQFHFTTVYVTHDQGEAMVTSDRIAVMNGGRNRADRHAVPGLHQAAHPLRRQLHRPYQSDDRDLSRPTDISFGSGSACHETCFPRGWRWPGIFCSPVRPQSIRLHATRWHKVCRATSMERAFLGETWDYLVTPASAAACA